MRYNIDVIIVVRGFTMNIEISKEQKEGLTQHLNLCVEFMKKEIQPYLTSTDNIVISVGEYLDLCLTCKKMYIKETRFWDLNFVEIPVYKTYYLERNNKSVKKYVCVAAPEIALEFLKQWDKIKYTLQEKKIQKTTEINNLNDFIDNFKC